jgi:hypothetical protein
VLHVRVDRDLRVVEFAPGGRGNLVSSLGPVSSWTCPARLEPARAR